MEKQSVILVEADILIRHPLAEYLRGCGYLVVEAVNADEARVVFERGEVGIDLALLDVSEETGRNFALAGWIRENRPQVEVLRAGTVAGALDTAQDLCSQQPDVTRPYDHKQVENRIRRLLAERDGRRREQDAS